MSRMTTGPELLRPHAAGLECPAGEFFVDPRTPVPRAVITHAHGDHARAGSGEYWCAEAGLGVLRHRLGSEAVIHGVPWGQAVTIGRTRVSFHPSGHVLGAAQVRIEAGQTWLVSGDYKRDPDPTCAPFEIVPCDVFVTEATFALPVYRWPDPARVFDDVHAWWQAGAAEGRASVLFCYALGKAQRVLAEMGRRSARPIYVHGAVESFVRCYRQAGIELPETRLVSETARGASFNGDLVLAPPSAEGTPWFKRFRQAETGFASGWMRIRGMRKRRGVDRGFVVSDHADWPALLATVEATGARRAFTTHGGAETLARALRERGLDAAALPVAYGAEDEA
jgi:putative mRNA 3-end processing factor